MTILANQVNAGFQETNTQLLALKALYDGLAAGTIVINDSGTAANDEVFSSLFVTQLIATAKQQVKDEMIDGADNSFDTFIEAHAAFLENEGDITAAMAAISANTTAVTTAQNTADNAVSAAATADAKAVTADGKAVTAASAAAAADGKAVQAQNDVTALTTAVGSTTIDYAAVVSSGL